MDTDERKRSLNFSQTEKGLLITLVKKYKNVIENKKSDTEANFKKIETWKIIEGEFNNLSGMSFRDVKVLKKKYDNLKKRTKKKFADEKCYKMGTGGGPSKDIFITDIDTDIKEILGARLEGLVAEFGGDVDATVMDTESAKANDLIANDTHFLEHDYFQVATEMETGNEDQERDEVVETEEVAVSVTENSTSTWSSYTPSMLRTPVSKPLTIKKTGTPKRLETNMDNRIAQWAEAKSALEDDKRKFLEEEQSLKLRCLKEKHEEELRCMKKECDQRMKFAAEVHEKKMDILELEKKKLYGHFKK